MHTNDTINVGCTAAGPSGKLQPAMRTPPTLAISYNSSHLVHLPLQLRQRILHVVRGSLRL